MGGFAKQLAALCLLLLCGCSSHPAPPPESRPRFVISIHSVDGQHSERMEFGEAYRGGFLSSYDRESGEIRTMPANLPLDWLIGCGNKFKRQ